LPGYDEGPSADQAATEKLPVAKGGTRQGRTAAQRDLDATGSLRSTGGWGNRHRKRKAQDEWQKTLLQDNAIGWGVHGYKAYTPVPIKMSTPKPANDPSRATNKVIAMPKDPKEAEALIKKKIIEACTRLNMKPQQFYNTMNSRKDKEGITKDDLKGSLYKLTKCEITDEVLKFVWGKLNPDGGPKSRITLKCLNEHMYDLVPPPAPKNEKAIEAAREAALIDAAMAAAKEKRAAFEKQRAKDLKARAKLEAKNAKARAKAERVAERAARRKEKEDRAAAKAAKAARKASSGGENKKKKKKKKEKPRRVGYDYGRTEFEAGDLVEVQVGGGDEDDDEEEEQEEGQWLPAVVESIVDEENTKVRMLVGYEEGENVFEVENACVRAIERKEGAHVNPDKIDEGTTLNCWNALQGEFCEAEVAFVTSSGTVKVTWSGVEDAEEEEVPLVYLRSATGLEDEDLSGSESGGGASDSRIEGGSGSDDDAKKKKKKSGSSKGKIKDGRSLCFIMNLRDLSPADFDAKKADAYKEQLAESLGLMPHQIEVRDLAAGSLIVDTKIHGLAPDQAKRLATKIVEDCATLLDKGLFGKAKVVRGELKEMADSDASDASGEDDEDDESGSASLSAAESADWTESEEEESEEEEAESEDSQDSDEEREKQEREKQEREAAEAGAKAALEAAKDAAAAGKPEEPLEAAPAAAAAAAAAVSKAADDKGGGGKDDRPNDLSEILGNLGMDAHYWQLHEAAGGSGAVTALHAMGEVGIAKAGLPLMRARKVWKQVVAIVASRADRDPLVADARQQMPPVRVGVGASTAAAAKANGRDVARDSPKGATAIPLYGGRSGGGGDDDDDDGVSARKGKLSAYEAYEESEQAKRRARAEAAAAAAFEAEMSGSVVASPLLAEEVKGAAEVKVAAAPEPPQPRPAVVAGLSAEWASPAEVEAELIWGRLEAHFERNRMGVRDFLRHVERVETADGTGAPDDARTKPSAAAAAAAKRELRTAAAAGDRLRP